MHDYNANDCDELELKAGDVVLVVTFESQDDQVSIDHLASFKQLWRWSTSRDC